jgi:hypothetical protein
MADVSLLYLCCSKSIMVFGTAAAVRGRKFGNFNRNATGRAQRYPPGHTRGPHGFSLPLSPMSAQQTRDFSLRYPGLIHRLITGNRRTCHLAVHHICTAYQQGCEQAFPQPGTASVGLIVSGWRFKASAYGPRSRRDWLFRAHLGRAGQVLE